MISLPIWKPASQPSAASKQRFSFPQRECDLPFIPVQVSISVRQDPANGVKTLVLVTEKNTTTLNLSLLCEGQKSGTRVTLRHLGSNATLSVGLRCRRDLLIGR